MRANKGKIIAKNADEIGGDTVESFIPDHYEGPVKVISFSNGSTIAVLPDVQEAISVANYACSYAGGFGSVELEPAQIEQITHKSFDSWAFD